MCAPENAETTSKRGAEFAQASRTEGMRWEYTLDVPRMHRQRTSYGGESDWLA
jgi:hypothetical protein